MPYYFEIIEYSGEGEDAVPGGNTELSLGTIAAIAAIVTSITVGAHESIHALVCAILEGSVQEFSALHVLCECSEIWKSKVVAGSASIGNLIFGGIAWYVLQFRRPTRMTVTVFFWLLMVLNWSQGAGYWLFTGISGLGDWATVISGVGSPLILRISLVILGAGSLLWFIVLSLRMLGCFIGGVIDVPYTRAFRLGFTSYLVAILVVALAGAMHPSGFFSLPVLAGLFGVIGGASPLVWMMFWFRSDSFTKVSGPILSLPFSWTWILSAGVVIVLYAFVLGRTIYF